MFHWAASHRLPERLLELLDRAQAQERPWEARSADVVILFLPPHHLIEMGCLSYQELLASYELLRQSLADTVGQTRLINGERLLSYSAEELSAWSVELPLPRPATLQPISIFSCHITKAVLDGSASLEAHYQWLDQHSLLGGSEPEHDYRCRLEWSDPEALVEACNLLCERRKTERVFDDSHHQLMAVENEFEQYVLSSRATASGLSRRLRESNLDLKRLQRVHKRHQVLQHNLCHRLMVLQARMAP